MTIWHIYRRPLDYDMASPVYGILVWGGLGIALGLVCYGERVTDCDVDIELQICCDVRR